MINTRALLIASAAGIILQVAMVVGQPHRASAAVVPHPATTADLAWLAGSWEGRMMGGTGIAEVMFAKPNAGVITGVMRLIDGGKVVVVELITLVDTPRGVEMRFRHFSPALEAYEREFKQAMRLVTSDSGRFVFQNDVPYVKELMSTQPRTTTFTRRGKDGFVGNSSTLSGDSEPGTVEVTYRRVK